MNVRPGARLVMLCHRTDAEMQQSTIVFASREQLQDSTLESFNLLRHQTSVHCSITLRAARKDQEKIFGFRGCGWETLLDTIANKAPCQRGQPPGSWSSHQAWRQAYWRNRGASGPSFRGVDRINLSDPLHRAANRVLIRAVKTPLAEAGVVSPCYPPPIRS